MGHLLLLDTFKICVAGSVALVINQHNGAMCQLAFTTEQPPRVKGANFTLCAFVKLLVCKYNEQ